MKTNENTSSTTHASVGHPARAEIARTVANPLEAHCIHVCTKFPQSLHETALCSSLTETLSLCTLLLQANAPPWQTSPCSSWVVARLFPASVGFTLPLAVPPSRPQQLRACQIITHRWPESLGQSRKPSNLSHICDNI